MPTHTTVSPTVRVDKAGGPEEMKLVDLPVGEPGPKEVRIRHHAIGLNFLDVYQRSGVYPLPLPLSLGNEAAGVIEAVGAEVTHLKAGDRAVYCGGPPGSYSLARVMAARHVVRLPDAISFETGAAMIWITHDLSVVAGLADRICVMYAGRIVEQGTVVDVLTQPRHPYTQGLLDSVPSRSRRGARLKQIPGMAPPALELPTGCAFRARCALLEAFLALAAVLFVVVFFPAFFVAAGPFARPARIAS